GPRHAGLRDVLAGDDLRPRLAADPHRGTHRQFRDRDARSRRTVGSRQRLSVSTLPEERDAGRARRVSVALYSDLIRERYRHPRFRGTLAEPDCSFEDVNPLCGDRIRIECRLADGKIADARFAGDSCAIAAASADVLIEMVIGQPAERAHELG